MHRDKTVARILLILSVVHLAVAGPAIVRQRSLDVDEDMKPASEKRGNPGDTSQDLSPVPQMGNELPGIPQSQDDPPPESGTPQLHNGQPQTSGPPSQDDTLPASGDPQSHSGPPAGSNDPQLHDDSSQWRSPPGWPNGDVVHGESLSDSSQELDHVPQMNNDRPSASGAPQLENNLQPASGTSPVHDDLQNAEGSPSSHGETPSLHELEAPPPHSPETNGVLSHTIKDELKVVAGYGAIAAVTAAVLFGGHKLYEVYAHKEYVSAFFPPSPADI